MLSFTSDKNYMLLQPFMCSVERKGKGSGEMKRKSSSLGMGERVEQSILCLSVSLLFCSHVIR